MVLAVLNVWADTAKFTNVIVARLRKCNDLIRKGKVFVENKTKVASGVNCSEKAVLYFTVLKNNKCVSKTHISPYAQLIPGGVVHGPLKGTNISANSVSTQVIFGVDLLTFRPDIAYTRPNCEKKQNCTSCVLAHRV